jgi:hypothetical protein
VDWSVQVKTTSHPGALDAAMALKVERFSSRVKYIMTPIYRNLKDEVYEPEIQGLLGLLGRL